MARYGQLMLQTWQIIHDHVPRASWQQCIVATVHRGISSASWPDGRAAEQNRDKAAQARAGDGGDHDSRNPVQIALAEHAMP